MSFSSSLTRILGFNRLRARAQSRGANRSHSRRAAASRTDGSAAPSAARAAVIEPGGPALPIATPRPAVESRHALRLRRHPVSSSPPGQSGLGGRSRSSGRPTYSVKIRGRGPKWIVAAQVDGRIVVEMNAGRPRYSRVPHLPCDGNAAVVSEPAKKPFGLKERNEDCAFEPTDRHRRSKRRRIRVPIPTNEEPIP